MRSVNSKIIDIINNKMANAIRFCMPAHNGIATDITAYYDITELSFSDNLQLPHGIIKDCEERIAANLHTNYALIFTCGATSALAAAIATAKHYGDTLIVDSRAHKSVFATARLQGLRVIQVDEFDDYSPQADVHIGGIIITTPDYYGNVYHINTAKALSAATHSLLICDQSHGSHFAFSALLPTPNDNVADITVNSWHKTMPTLTGGAVATCNDSDIHDIMVYNRSMTHSTSPSYMTIASIDYANELMKKNGEEYYNAIKIGIKSFKDSLCKRYSVTKNDDFSRLVISTLGKSATAIARALEEHNIYVEMTYQDKLVMIVTPFNYMYLPTLAARLNTINSSEPYTNVATLPKVKTTEYNVGIEFIPLGKALGRVSASEVGIYPPGIPILTSGDIITKEIIEYIQDNISACFGLVSGKLVCYRRQ